MSDGAVTDLTRGVYRRLYGGFITGQRINKLSLQAEAWFWRVFVAADDFGNGRADPELCRSATAGNRKVTARQVGCWLQEMGNVGLLEFYAVRNERFLHIVGFEASQPAGKNGKRLKRFPGPDESGEIRVNPDSSSASDSDTHSEDDPYSDNEAARMPFASEEFREAMADLEQHRIEIRHRITPRTRKLMYADFLEWGELRSIAAIRLSIRNGWRGVFEGRDNRNGSGGSSKVDNSVAATKRVVAKYEQQG